MRHWWKEYGIETTIRQILMNKTLACKILPYILVKNRPSQPHCPKSKQLCHKGGSLRANHCAIWSQSLCYMVLFVTQGLYRYHRVPTATSNLKENLQTSVTQKSLWQSNTCPLPPGKQCKQKRFCGAHMKIPAKNYTWTYQKTTKSQRKIPNITLQDYSTN